jgi:predicted DNA-binding transcriptional regulator AlpA
MIAILSIPGSCRESVQHRKARQSVLIHEEFPMSDLHTANRKRRPLSHDEAIDTEEEKTVAQNRVRSLRETAAMAGVSLATLRRRIADGTGPRVTRVSERRVGIRDRDREVWLDRCATS